MKIYTLDEILKTGHIGDEKYVRYEEIERLKEIITLKDKLLIAYRMGPVHSVKIEKVLDRLQALKEE